MPELWVPGAAGPSLEGFVERLHHTVEQYAERRKIERPYVEVLLHDGTRFGVHSIRPEPGFGFLTLCPFPEDGPPESSSDECPPEELVVPVGSIVRIRLSEAPEHEAGFGFTVVPAPG
jgi:hypothetical protein